MADLDLEVRLGPALKHFVFALSQFWCFGGFGPKIRGEGGRAPSGPSLDPPLFCVNPWGELSDLHFLYSEVPVGQGTYRMFVNRSEYSRTFPLLCLPAHTGGGVG